MEKKIMISILCLRMWHKAVAFAVYHGQDNQAIVFPDEVKCRAFCYSNGAFTESTLRELQDDVSRGLPAI